MNNDPEISMDDFEIIDNDNMKEINEFSIDEMKAINSYNLYRMYNNYMDFCKIINQNVLVYKTTLMLFHILL